MRFALAALLGLSVAWLVPSGAGQVPTLQPELEIGDPTLPAPVPVGPATIDLAVPWTYTFPDPATAAATTADGATIEWSLDCGPAITMTPTVTPIQFEPGRTQYSGTAALPVQAASSARGLQATPCVLDGDAESALPATAFPSEPRVPKAIALQVAYEGNFTVRVVDDHKTSGPQKLVRFDIEITNLGNARTQFTFEVLDEPSGKWNALLPEVLLLDSPNAGLGSPTNTAIFTVATPYHNGYNSDKGTYVIRIHGAAADDSTQTVEPVEVTLRASAKGWYIPGPSPALMLVGLALAALATRRLR